MLKNEEGDKPMPRDQAWYHAEMMKMARMMAAIASSSASPDPSGAILVAFMSMSNV